MSFHMHLRAVPEGEVRADAAWLETFMGDAWDVLEVEYAAGVAEAIEKDFGMLHELYSATPSVDGSADPGWELPVYGGRVVNYPDHGRPPFVLLGSREVGTTAEFLDGADVDALWGVVGDKLSAPWVGFDSAQVKEYIRKHHDGLRGFYGRAAAAGHEVVKAFWY